MKKYMILFFCVIVPIFLTAMDQPEVLTPQQKALKEIQELKAKVDHPKYHDGHGVKPYSPIHYLEFMKRRIYNNPNLAIKDIKNGQTSLTVYLAEDDECHEILKFMLDNGAPAEVSGEGNGKNSALHKALWA